MLQITVPLQKMILQSIAPQTAVKEVFCTSERKLRILVAAEPNSSPHTRLQDLLRTSGLQSWPGVCVRYTDEETALVELSTATGAGGQGLTPLQCCAVIRVGLVGVTVTFWSYQTIICVARGSFYERFCRHQC